MSKTLKNKKDKDDYRLPKWLRVIFKLLITIVILFSIGVVALDIYLKVKTGNSIVDDINYAIDVVDNSNSDSFKANAGTIYYDASGEVLGYQNTVSNESTYTYVDYDEIPDNVKNAFIAIEDPTFWENNGTSVKGLTRAFLGYVGFYDTTSGGSTITQQIAKNTFLSQEVSVDRKVKEIFCAIAITNKYSKEDLLEYYINQVYFSNRIYGIEDASQMYFAKPASELTLSQAAYLAAIPNRPTYYNPLTNPENAVSRRDRILAAMLEQELITQAEYDEAINEEIVIDTSNMEAIEAANEDKVNNNNYLMTYAEDCAQEYLAEYFNISKDEAATLLAEGEYKVQTTLNTEVEEELQNAIDSSLSFATAQDDNGYYLLQSAGTVIDNDTGKVIAIVGGRSQDNISTLYGLNRAFQSYRQPGSSIKPLVVYTPAIMTGIKPSTFASKVWESNNDTAKNIFKRIGYSYGISFLHDMNFSKIVDEDETLAAALGGLTYGVTTEEMASAYSCLANYGQFTEPTCIVSITNTKGEELYEDSESYEVYDSDAASDMTDILKGVIKQSSGTAHKMGWYSSSDVEVAGKTGTTNDCKDGWFCGYCSDYTISIWVGRDDHKAVSGLYGSSYPVTIWKKAMLSTIDILGVDNKSLGSSQAFYSAPSTNTTTTTDTDKEKTDETVTEETTTTTQDTTNSTDSITNNTQQNSTTNNTQQNNTTNNTTQGTTPATETPSTEQQTTTEQPTTDVWVDPSTTGGYDE
jgi:membrane peptidoglycan carboxypeptidase